MKSKVLLGLLVICLFAAQANAQEKEKVELRDGVVLDLDTDKKVELKKPKKFYDPKVASRRSAILPGLGQIYNDSWWKVPILYGGFGICVYYIGFNNEQRVFYEDLARDLIQQQSEGIAIDTNALRVYRRRADTWRSNRDLLYLVTLGVYILNIAEAAIDAHLKGFDVSENLGLNLKPKLGMISNGAPYLGIGFTLPIGK